MEQNGIQFNSVKTEDYLNFESGPIRIAHSSGVDSELGGVINAVDIDWNDADFTNATAQNPGTISTSGDLIKAIKWASTVGSGSGGWTWSNGCNWCTRY